MILIGVEELVGLAKEGKYGGLRRQLLNGNNHMSSEDKKELLKAFPGPDPKWHNFGCYCSCVFFLTEDYEIVANLIRQGSNHAADVVVRDFKKDIPVDKLDRLKSIAKETGEPPILSTSFGMNYHQLLFSCEPTQKYHEES